LVVARTIYYNPYALPKLNRAQHIVGRRAGYHQGYIQLLTIPESQVTHSFLSLLQTSPLKKVKGFQPFHLLQLSTQLAESPPPLIVRQSKVHLSTHVKSILIKVELILSSIFLDQLDPPQYHLPQTVHARGKPLNSLAWLVFSS